MNIQKHKLLTISSANVTLIIELGIYTDNDKLMNIDHSLPQKSEIYSRVIFHENKNQVKLIIHYPAVYTYFVEKFNGTYNK